MVAQDVEAVLAAKYPAKSHSRRFFDIIRQKMPGATGVLYLEGRMTRLHEDSDSRALPRRYFYYLTGCDLADCHFAYDIESSKAVLFIPPLDAADVIWSGLPVSPDDALRIYDVDEVRFTTDVNPTLTHLATQHRQSTVFAIAGQVSDHVTLIEFETKDFDALKNAIDVARVIKDDFEVALIRKANQVSGLAHAAVLDRARSAANERELEAAFVERCLALGAKEMAYHPILAAGKAAATLHYVDNNAPLQGKLNLLIDAGAQWHNYAADVTRTFPLSGSFTKETRSIYDVVFEMQKACISMIKADMFWDDVHLQAHRVAIDGLLSLSILKGDADKILEPRTSAAFFPHGLGHFLGLETHDVGGNPNRQKKEPFFRYLRLRGRVPAGSVVTVEPGLYFCAFIIKPYLKDPVHAKHIDSTVLDKYWDVGGVRIEDNVLVTKSGSENLTTTIKEPGEIEAQLCH